MLNIPVLQEQWLDEDEKDNQSPCPTNYTSFSESLHIQPTAYQQHKNQRKYSHPHRATDWIELQRSVLEWFDDNKITLGHPEEIIEGAFEECKKEVVKKLSGESVNQQISRFERRRGRKLTISI